VTFWRVDAYINDAAVPLLVDVSRQPSKITAADRGSEVIKRIGDVVSAKDTGCSAGGGQT